MTSCKGEELRRDELLRLLVDIQYERNDIDFHRGTFRVRGDVVEIFPVYEEATAIRVEFFGDEVDGISEVDPLRGRVLGSLDRYAVFPGSHYVTPRQQMNRAIGGIREELKERLEFFDREGRFLEKQRLEQRTMYDLEMLEQMGFVQGIENYSRHLSDRARGIRRRRSSTTSRRISCSSSTSRTRRSRRSARCTAAIARGRRRWSSSASGCPARSTIGR
ncbi:MAG: hypothetical protein QM756_21560 [Polyangiaceae bacterium]